MACTLAESLNDPFQRESGIPMQFSMDKLAVLLKKRGCTQTTHVPRDGKRHRGWLGVRLADAAGRTGPIHVKIK
jgi:hypothetical protein